MRGQAEVLDHFGAWVDVGLTWLAVVGVFELLMLNKVDAE